MQYVAKLGFRATAAATTAATRPLPPTLPPRFAAHLCCRLAAQHQSTNLGQGFPDDELEGPASMKEIVHRCWRVLVAPA